MTQAHPQSTPSSLTVNQALQQAVAHHKVGRLQEAERLYRAILQTEPSHPDANHNLGVLAVGVGKAELGLPHLKAALEVNPGYSQYWLSYIEALLAAGKLKEAGLVLEQGKAQGLSGVAFEALMARIKVMRPNQAIADTPIFPVTPPIQSQQRLGEEAQGKIVPPSVPDLFTQALRHHLAGQLAEAEVLYRQILSVDASHAESLHLLGMIAYQRGDLERSVEMITKAISLNNKVAIFHSNLGNILGGQGRLDEAIARYEQAITIKPDFAEALTNLGNALVNQGRLDKAIARYEQAIAIKPDYAEALSNLGHVLFNQGKLDEAITRYEQVLVLKPDHTEAHSNLGTVLQGLGRNEEALEYYVREEALMPKDGWKDALRDLGSPLLLLLGNQNATTSRASG